MRHVTLDSRQKTNQNKNTDGKNPKTKEKPRSASTYFSFLRLSLATSLFQTSAVALYYNEKRDRSSSHVI